MIWKGLNIQTKNGIYPPKPASLLLAEIAIKIAKPDQKILDACCGSGIVGIAISKFVQNTTVVASDINPKAIEAAKRNAKKNNVKIKAVQSELFAQFSDDEFDLIAIHPPAVPYLPGQTCGMSKGMTIATNGGEDGSKLVVRSIIEAKRCLKKNGKLLLLLPHWSNTKKAFEALRSNYQKVSELARERIDFFPVLEGKPSAQLLEYTYELAKKGEITIEFDNQIPHSYASVIEALK